MFVSMVFTDKIYQMYGPIFSSGQMHCDPPSYISGVMFPPLPLFSVFVTVHQWDPSCTSISDV